MSKKDYFLNKRSQFRDLILEILKSANFNVDVKTTLLHRASGKNWFNKGVFIQLDDAITEKYDELIRKFELTEEGKFFSIKEFENIIFDKLFAYLENHQQTSYDKTIAGKLVQEIFKEIANQTFEGVVFVPLYGIDFQLDSLVIGNCKIVKVTKDWCKKKSIKNKNWSSVFVPSDEPSATFSIGNKKLSWNIGMGDVCAEILIKASKSKVQDVSLNYINEIMGFLWLYVSLNPSCFEDRLSFGAHFEKQTNFGIFPFYIKDRVTGKINQNILSFEKSKLDTLPLNEQIISIYKNKGRFLRYSKLLFRNDANPEMIERLRIALSWYGKAMVQVDITQKMLFLSLALEALLSPDDKMENIIGPMSEAVAFLFYNNIEKRIEIMAALKRLYDQRSSVVHGRTNIVSTQDVTDMQRIVKMTIVSILGSKYSQTSFAEFMDQIKRFRISYRIKTGEF